MVYMILELIIVSVILSKYIRALPFPMIPELNLTAGQRREQC